MQAASEWLYIVPWGIRNLINYVARKYGNPKIYITENGKDSMLLTFRWCVFISENDGEFQLFTNHENHCNTSLSIGISSY